MAETERARTTVGASGTATVRQRPALLLMKLRLRAAAATLELRLARLQKQCEVTTQWLKRLGAIRVEFGEPHFADQASNLAAALPMMRAAALALGNQPAEAAEERNRDVAVMMTALWNVAAMSAEETLVLVDRLRFEAAPEASTPEASEDSPQWTTPEENFHEIMTQIIQQQAAADGAPQFLFIARLGEEQLQAAYAEAFSRARQHAERLARAAGMRLGKLAMVQSSDGALDQTRPDKFMDRQRCVALLAGSSYDLGEHEMVSDDPRAAEFTISVNVSYSLE
jgi:hypothetical protein